MKTTLHRLKWIALTLCALLVFQSCTVYKSSTISLSEAVEFNAKVKIKSTEGEKRVIQRIKFTDGKYLGEMTRKGQKVIVPLNEDDIESIRPKNKTLSTVINIGVPVLLVGVIVAIAFANWEREAISSVIFGKSVDSQFD